MKIHRRHFRECGFCRKGTQLLAEAHGISWDDLCGEGVDEEIILATGDNRAYTVVNYAHSKNEGKK